MAKLEGQPLSAIIAKIGLPIEARTIAGKKVYIWGTPELSSDQGKDAQCQIQATMNGDVIERLAYVGNENLCERYAARLRTYSP
jgi:hypothetical protein